MQRVAGRIGRGGLLDGYGESRAFVLFHANGAIGRTVALRGLCLDAEQTGQHNGREVETAAHRAERIGQQLGFCQLAMVGVVETDSQRAVWHRLKSIALAREADTAKTHSLPRAVDAAVGEDLPRLPQAVIGIAIIEEPRRHTECRRKGIFSVRSEVAQAVIAARQQHLPRAVALIGGLCAARVGAVGFDRSAFKGLARCAVYQNHACFLA